MMPHCIRHEKMEQYEAAVTEWDANVEELANFVGADDVCYHASPLYIAHSKGERYAGHRTMETFENSNCGGSNDISKVCTLAMFEGLKVENLNTRSQIWPRRDAQNVDNPPRPL